MIVRTLATACLGLIGCSGTTPALRSTQESPATATPTESVVAVAAARLEMTPPASSAVQHVIAFRVGHAEIRPESLAALDELALELLDAHAPVVVRVHSRATPADAPVVQTALSLQRARAVHRALLQRGVPSDRLATRDCAGSCGLDVQPMQVVIDRLPIDAPTDCCAPFVNAR